jgi:hypothetical protein
MAKNSFFSLGDVLSGLNNVGFEDWYAIADLKNNCAQQNIYKRLGLVS